MPPFVLSCASERRWLVDMHEPVGEWRNARLTRVNDDGSPFVPEHGRHFSEKRSLWIGWNGERLSRGKAAAWAEANEPDLLPQLIDRLSAA